MGKIAASVSRIYLDEFDLSGVLNSFDLSLEQERAVVTALSDAGPRRVVGNYDHKHSVQGFFDGDTGKFDAQAFVDFRTDEDHFLATIFGTTEGSRGYEDVIRNMGQPRSGGTGGAVLLSLEGEGSGGRVRCWLLRTATLAGAGNGAGQNLGATTAGQVFAAVFRLLAFTGTSITLKVQESSDDGAVDLYADIAGLTSGALTAKGVVRATTTAATEAWKRLAATGTFTSAQIIVTVGTVAGS